MLRKSFAFIGTLIALIFIVGIQSSSSAQSAFSISWATSGTSTILVNTNVSYSLSAKTGLVSYPGQFGFSGSGFATKSGSVTSLVCSTDSVTGTSTATVIGSVRYYVVSSGKIATSYTAATATLVLSKLSDGTSSESLTIVETSTKLELYSTGSLWSLSRGSLDISL